MLPFEKNCHHLLAASLIYHCMFGNMKLELNPLSKGMFYIEQKYVRVLILARRMKRFSYIHGDTHKCGKYGNTDSQQFGK